MDVEGGKSFSACGREQLIDLRLIITDVDGVLTDGGITFTNSGEEIKTFDVKDGAGIKYWQRAGGMIAFLTGRASSVVMRRAEELGVDFCVMNAKDKLPEFWRILETLAVKPQETVYIGDDWPDIACLRAAGLGVAVADATPETLAAADVITQKNGGRGAVREVIDTILRAQNKLEALLARYNKV